MALIAGYFFRGDLEFPRTIFVLHALLDGAALAAGVRVPEDLSVVGFGDLPVATSEAPHLTTMRIDCAAMGSAAVRRLAERIRRIKPSATLAVTARAAQLRAEGKDIIALGAGEPDFDTPAHIADAGVAATKNGSRAPIPEVRDVIRRSPDRGSRRWPEYRRRY